MTDEMLIGRELDIRVAVQVMGFRQVPFKHNPEQLLALPPDTPDTGTRQSPDSLWWLGKSVNGLVPNYSTDIADAWTVFLKVCTTALSTRFRFYSSLQWQSREKSANHWMVMWPDVLTVLAEDMPAAICRAALEATQS